jgi:single-strand DNA-binding protein
MNRVELIGRITAKPELRYTNSNLPYTRFSIAIDRMGSEPRVTDFINITAWRKTAENVCQYMDKGSLVAVEGSIQTNNYTDKDGNKRTSFDVVAQRVQFLESKKNSSNNGGQSPYDFQNQPEQTVNANSDVFADFGDSVSIDDDFLD